MILAFEISRDIDLRDFSALLFSHGVRHRISESGNNQAVWVPGEAEKEAVARLYQAWDQGLISIPKRETSEANGGESRGGGIDTLNTFIRVILTAARRYPVTLFFFLASVLTFVLVMGFGENWNEEYLALLTFVELEIEADSVYFADLSSTLDRGEYWRIFTPMFIHFGWMHLVFNMLWLWEVGRRIEIVNGSGALALVILFSSAVSNIAQYLFTGPSLFGGMSGVVFAVLGHSFVWSRMVRSRSTGLPHGIYIFLLIYLALGFTGAVDLLGMGAIANWAHLGGLLAGLLTGFLAAVWYKSTASD